MSGYYYGDFTIPASFVTPADVADWMGMLDADGQPSTAQLPATILPIIRSCTRMVCKATMGSFYDADPDTGLPTDAQALQAMQDATCIQAAAWVALDINPFLAGMAENVVETSTKLASAAVSYSVQGAAAAAADRAWAAKHLVPEATSVLVQNDLLGTQVWTYG